MLHELRFCAFETPDGWQALPGTGAAFADKRGLLGSAVARAEWSPKPVPAAAWGERMCQALKAEPDTERILEAGPYPVDGPGEGYRIVHASIDREGRTSRTARVCLSCGPLACHLAVMNLVPPPDGERSVAEVVAESFHLRNVEPLTPAVRAAVLAGPAPSAALRLTTEHPFPRQGMAVGVPEGWQAEDGEDAGRLTTRGCELRVAQPAAGQLDAAAWLGGRMEELAGSEDHRIAAWDDGSLPDGREFIAIRYQHDERVSTWVKPKMVECVDLLVLGDSPVEWRLRVSDGWFPDLLAAMRSVVASQRELADPECEVRLAEPWLPMVLPGRWTPLAEGTYVREGPPRMMLVLGRYPCPGKVKGALPSFESIIDELRGEAGLVEVLKQDQAVGIFRGLEAFRFALDGRFHDGPRSARGAGVVSERVLYNVVLRGDDAGQVDRLFLLALEHLDVPGIEPLAKPLVPGEAPTPQWR